MIQKFLFWLTLRRRDLTPCEVLHCLKHLADEGKRTSILIQSGELNYPSGEKWLVAVDRFVSLNLSILGYAKLQNARKQIFGSAVLYFNADAGFSTEEVLRTISARVSQLEVFTRQFLYIDADICVQSFRDVRKSKICFENSRMFAALRSAEKAVEHARYTENAQKLKDIIKQIEVAVRSGLP
jgi:hypothetical protein